MAGTAVVDGRGGRQEVLFLLPALLCGKFSWPLFLWMAHLCMGS